MKTTKYYMFFLLSLVFRFISISSSHAGTDFNLSGQWPKVSAGPDPGQPDTVYLECLTQSSQQIIQVRLKTDNVGVEDSILGFYVPLLIVTDQDGVVLDTQFSTIFGGTVAANWEIKGFAVYSNGGDPSQFPMQVAIGAAEIVTAPPVEPLLGAGDHLLANLAFNLSTWTRICIDTMTYLPDNPLVVVMSDQFQTGYTPEWRHCCTAGDANSDGGVGLSDIIWLVNFVYKAGPAPAPLFAADVNADCSVNLIDIIFLVNYIFKNGPAPLLGCAQ